MKKFNLEAFKRDEVALKNLSNVQGGSGAGSSTMVFYMTIALYRYQA